MLMSFPGFSVGNEDLSQTRATTPSTFCLLPFPGAHWKGWHKLQTLPPLTIINQSKMVLGVMVDQASPSWGPVHIDEFRSLILTRHLLADQHVEQVVGDLLSGPSWSLRKESSGVNGED